MDENVQALYTRMWETAPHALAQLGWSDGASQRQAYKAVAQRYQALRRRGVVDPTVLDVGCGTGDLWLYLREFEGMAPFYYTGFDTNEEAIGMAAFRAGAVAQERESTPVFYPGDIFSEGLSLQFDLVVGVGILSWYDDAKVWQILDRMWKLAGREVVLVQHRETTNIPLVTDIGRRLDVPHVRSEASGSHITLILGRDDA